MNERLAYLKDRVSAETEDVLAYAEILKRSYDLRKGEGEIFRKSGLLTDFANNIPIEIDEKELICGSLRFWKAMDGCHNMGHIIVDYEMLLNDGLPAIKEKISRLTTYDGRAFAEAFDAFELFIGRCGEKAAALGMTDVADNCQRIVNGRVQYFHEALQLVWFVHLFLHAEATSPAISFGRFDKYMYPFYKRSLENGATREELKELLACFWLKCCEGDESQNLTIGGDVENDLTFACIEVTGELKVWQPSLSVRINEKTTDSLWASTVRLVKKGIGMPSIFNDAVVIESLKNLGISEKDAENYGIVGCYEANPSGNTYGTTSAIGLIYLHKILLEFLDVAREYGGFYEFYADFLAFFKNKYETDILAAFRARWAKVGTDSVSPFQGLCFRDCLEKGICAEKGGCKYTMCGVNILGIGTLIDSIYCIKRVVFEEKYCSYSEFVTQVKENFPDRTLAQRLRKVKGKYGTDSEETNALAHELSGFIADLVDNGRIADGVIPYAGLFIFLGDVNSEKHPATPDGRFAGERLSYGIAASDICEGKTVTSVLNSAANIRNDRFADGNPLLIRINESEVEGEKGDAILRSLIAAYFEKGGFHIHVNVVDSQTLKKAQQYPGEYKDLTVRISGYSARFTTLSKVIQDALIERA